MAVKLPTAGEACRSEVTGRLQLLTLEKENMFLKVLEYLLIHSILTSGDPDWIELTLIIHSSYVLPNHCQHE